MIIMMLDDYYSLQLLLAAKIGQNRLLSKKQSWFIGNTGPYYNHMQQKHKLHVQWDIRQIYLTMNKY